MSAKTFLVAVVLFHLGLMSSSMAQQQQGDVELQLQGSFFTTVGADITNSVGTIAGKVGPYITANIQVGIGPTLTIATNTSTAREVASGPLVTTTKTNVTFGSTIFAVYSFLFPDARTVPYVGASYYKRDFSNGADRGWIGGNGGAKFFFTKRAAADLSVNYLTSLNKETKGGLLLFAFGLSLLF